MSANYYIGIDIGGTKILTGLTTSRGKILSRVKTPTPHRAKAHTISKTTIETAERLCKEVRIPKKSIKGIGVGVPGIVDTKTGRILEAPNINLSHFPLREKIKEKFYCPVEIGNDVNLGLLGENWLGAGQKADNIVGIFPGTGIGGGVMINKELLTGTHGAAGEIGHIIVIPNGPKCTCGNSGCLEAISSRWAMERDIRRYIKHGRKSIITKLNGKSIHQIKSKVFRKAFKRHDTLTLQIMREVCKNLGLACISLRHIFDPEKILFGGGLIEACGDFMLPEIRKIFNKDPFFKRLPKCPLVASRLKDDAVILGAVYLVKS